MPKLGFKPDSDIPDLSGKVVFITGGTAGIGKEALFAFTKHHPARIFFTGRNSKAGEEVVEQAKAIDASVEVRFWQCDQDSLSSVDAAADYFASVSDRLDFLICNAGVMMLPPSQTKEGYEKQFGINHVAHALLIRRLLPILQRTAVDHDVRIVAVSSSAFYFPPTGGILFKDLKTPQDMTAGSMLRYGQSKLANVLYAHELNERYKDITTVAIHPGYVQETDLQRSLPFLQRKFLSGTNLGMSLTNEEGGYNTEWAATTAKQNLKSGQMYSPVGKPMSSSKHSANDKMREQLWEWTQTELNHWEEGKKAAVT